MNNTEYHLSTSAIASKLKIISSQNLFLYLIQLGWIIKKEGKYQLTTLGETKGGKYQSGSNESSWIVWPLDIIREPAINTIPENFLKTSRPKPIPHINTIDKNSSNLDITPKLDRLAKLHNATVSSKAEYDAKRTAIIDKIQSELDTLDAEYAHLFEALEQQETELVTEIKEDVVLYGKSIAGYGVKAIYVKGRIYWNPKELNQYAKTHPDILALRKQSQPSVRIIFNRIEPFNAHEGNNNTARQEY